MTRRLGKERIKEKRRQESKGRLGEGKSREGQTEKRKKKIGRHHEITVDKEHVNDTVFYVRT